MELFDTHCHVDLDAFTPDRAIVLESARDAGVRQILVPAVTADRWPSLLQLCAQERGLYPALGLHPLYLAQHTARDISSLEEQVRQNRPVAIGECGLDFFDKNLDRKRQIQLFRVHLELAEAVRLPLVLHVRKGHHEVLAMLNEYSLQGGICHAFNGDMSQAGKYIDQGFKLGFGGTLTYPNAVKIHKLARALPPEAMVLETDAPDMSLHPQRSERNEPKYLRSIAGVLAKLKNMETTELAKITTDNARVVLAIHASTQRRAGNRP